MSFATILQLVKTRMQQGNITDFVKVNDSSQTASKDSKSTVQPTSAKVQLPDQKNNPQKLELPVQSLFESRQTSDKKELLENQTVKSDQQSLTKSDQMNDKPTLSMQNQKDFQTLKKVVEHTAQTSQDLQNTINTQNQKTQANENIQSTIKLTEKKTAGMQDQKVQTQDIQKDIVKPIEQKFASTQNQKTQIENFQNTMNTEQKTTNAKNQKNFQTDQNLQNTINTQQNTINTQNQKTQANENIQSTVKLAEKKTAGIQDQKVQTQDIQKDIVKPAEQKTASTQSQKTQIENFQNTINTEQKTVSTQKQVNETAFLQEKVHTSMQDVPVKPAVQKTDTQQENQAKNVDGKWDKIVLQVDVKPVQEQKNKGSGQTKSVETHDQLGIKSVIDYPVSNVQTAAESTQKLKNLSTQNISHGVLAENVVSSKKSDRSIQPQTAMTVRQAQLIVKNAIVQIRDSTSEFTQFRQIKRELPEQLKTSQPIKIENFKLEIARDLKKETAQIIQQPQMEKLEQTEQVKELLNTKLARKTYENENEKIPQNHQQLDKSIDSVIVRVEQEQKSSNIQTIAETIKQMQDGLTQKATVDLMPPNLGKVEIEIVKQQDKLLITLKVATDETREMLEKSSKDLISRLNTLGFKVEQVEVKISQKTQEDQLSKDQQQDSQHEKRQKKQQQKEVNEDDQRD